MVRAAADRLALRLLGASDDALVDVRLKHAEGLLVALHGQMQRMEQALGREVVGNDSLRDLHCLAGNAERLGVQAEVDDQLFRRAGYAAEVGVGGDGVLVFDLHSLPLLLLVGGGLLFFGFFSHEEFSVSC